MRKLAGSAAGLLLMTFATPAMAQIGIGGGFTISAEARATTDYRFRGISQTGGDPALQGSATLDHSSGFYIGGFASTLKDDLRPGRVELSGYAGFTREISPGTDIDVGLQVYGYPDNESLTNASYFEPYASISHRLGPVTAQVGAHYAPKQEALVDRDSLYVYAAAEAGLGLISLPITVTGRVGYTSGPARFTSFVDYLDWRFGAEYQLGPATIALEYVDTDLPDVPEVDSALVATLRIGF